jgi:preprotein translocase subunit SecG
MNKFGEKKLKGYIDKIGIITAIIFFLIIFILKAYIKNYL